MSQWTQITTSIYIDTNIKETNIKEIIENKLKEAPKITGSEENAEIFVNIKRGYSVYNSCDCKNCPYKNTIITEKYGYSCAHPKNYKCKEINYQTNYQTNIVITIAGSLRDRNKQRTREEYKNFIKWLKKNINGYYRAINCRINAN